MYSNRAKLVYINTDYNGIAIFDYEEDEYDCLYYATGFDSNSIAKLKCWAENEEFDNIRDFVRNLMPLVTLNNLKIQLILRGGLNYE